MRVASLVALTELRVDTIDTDGLLPEPVLGPVVNFIDRPAATRGIALRARARGREVASPR